MLGAAIAVAVIIAVSGSPVRVYVRARWSCRKPEEGIQWRVEWIFVAENARLINTRYQLLVESDVDYMQTSVAHVDCDGG